MDNFLYNDIFLRNTNNQNNKESFNNVELREDFSTPAPKINNGDFSIPDVGVGYKYVGNITGWNTWKGPNGGGIIITNKDSSSWIFKQPYPNNADQCIIIQKTAGFKTSNTNIFYPDAFLYLIAQVIPVFARERYQDLRKLSQRF